VKVFLTDDAIDDLRWATQYYGTLFPEGLENFINNYTTTKMLLSDNPLLGRKYERVGGVRILNVVRTPFAFFFLQSAEGLIDIVLTDVNFNHVVFNSFLILKFKALNDFNALWNRCYLAMT